MSNFLLLLGITFKNIQVLLFWSYLEKNYLGEEMTMQVPAFAKLNWVTFTSNNLQRIILMSIFFVIESSSECFQILLKLYLLQLHKIIKHTRIIRGQIADELCEFG